MLCRAAHGQAAAPGGVGLQDALVPDDDAAGGEVRPVDEVHQVVDGDIVEGVVVVDQVGDGVDQLAQIVRRDVGRHADGDARRAVEQQVGQARGQHQSVLAACRRSCR